MKILIMRHGETDANKNLIIQGRTDNPLNDTGIQQAINKQEHFNDFIPELVITSSLIRTKQTYESLNSIYNWDCETIVNDNFIERDFGLLDGQSINMFYETKDFSKVKGYENDLTLQTRIRNGLNDIVNLNIDNLLVVAHSHILKSILIILGVEPDYAIKLENCQILELKYENDELTFVDLY